MKNCKIDLKGLNLKEFIEMTEDEKKEFVERVWGWGGEKWKNEQLKKHYFFRTRDGFEIAIENEKYISIDKDLWFDDELPIPEKSKRLFIEYNLRKCYDVNDAKKMFFMQAYYGKHENVVHIKTIYYMNDYEFEKRQEYFKRDLTEEEMKEYLKIRSLIKTKYIERLDKYFDKYGQKSVFCRGYWVNR